MERQMAQLKAKLGESVEFSHLDGPISGMLAADDDVEQECLPPYYQWWEPLDGLAGQLEAVRHVAEYIRAKGPFDALLGFSEGAACATAFLAAVHGAGRGGAEVRQQLKAELADVTPPRLVISICGIPPDDFRPGCFCFGRGSSKVCEVPVPSIHVIGENDSDRRGSEELAQEWYGVTSTLSTSSKKNTSKMLRHPHGHRFPLDCRQLADAIQEMVCKVLKSMPNSPIVQQSYAHAMYSGGRKVLAALRREKRWLDALQILEEAKACSAQPDTVCYNIVLSIFRDFRWWAQALVTLGHMEQAGPQASVVSYSTVVSACESSTCWQVAVSLLQKTWDRGLAADIILLCAAASACGKALRWDLALHLSNLSMAESMGETGVAQNALPAVNAAMSAFGGLWEKAVELFAGLQCSGMRPDTVSYGAAMQNCDCASQWVQANAILAQAVGSIQPSVVVFGLAASCFAKGKVWQQALEMLIWSCSSGLREEAPLCGAVLSSCEKVAAWRRAINLLHEQAGQRHPRPNVLMYSSAISACEKAHQWHMALWILSQMWAEGPRPDVVALNAGLAACEKSGRWEQAFLLCETGMAQRLSLNTISYNSLFSALAVGQSWQHARELHLLDEMKAATVVPDTITYNSLIAGCTRRKDWELMLTLFLEMRSSELQPDSFSYGSALSVCDQAENWQLAMLLLKLMQIDLVQSNVLIYNSALGACDAPLMVAKAGKWRLSLHLLSQVCAQEHPDQTSFNSVLRACLNSLSSPRETWRVCLSVLAKMSEQLLDPDPKSFSALCEAAEKVPEVRHLPEFLAACSTEAVTIVLRAV
ncbi:unnamed protein product [Symbiodinium natans]|uniref:Serine hydrolase domain-containing protein n=1 Tax=Symbiodinium natans TaxID=878477 RepID=A0A812KZF0_9DINO|nr:unnamed protein product [Symbiodinium natans]